MMAPMAVVFWLSLLGVVYTYLAYPLCAAIWARWRGVPVKRGPFSARVSIVVAAHNEAARIGSRVAELRDQLRRADVAGEVIVVSDGSTDGTAVAARETANAGEVVVLELSERLGKAAALTRGWQQAQGEIVAFADCRQRWADNALARMLENFADPAVGAVSGELVLEASPGVLAGVGFYWRFEKWLRRQESSIHSQVGVTGAIAAARRELLRPMPTGLILDDVYWPLQVVLQGRRVVHDERAMAYDRLPDRPRDEFRRKVRTLAGNFQLAAALPRASLPWRNPVWLAWVSHKLARLLVPWLLIGLFAASWWLPGTVYQAAFWTQLVGYSLSGAGLWPALARRSKLLGAAASFLVLHAAAWLGFWVWLTGRCERSWTKVHYSVSPAAT
ncbi:MAG: glycosyltransferase [Gemmataceae bacterium]|nr:glycosyltransferase [Gemmataceae bacterium]